MKRTREKGITLVALVITILIMLILAGVAIHFTIGEDALFQKVAKGKEEYQKEQKKEEADLEQLYSQMLIATNDDTKITISLEDLNKIIEDKVNEKIQSTILTPDYEKPEKIEFVEKSYTVEKDGFIQIVIHYTQYSAGLVLDEIFINNQLVFRNSSEVKWQNPLTSIFAVKKGDVIRYNNTAQEIEGYYYPIR